MFKENIPARQYISEFADCESAFRSVLDLPYGDKKKLLIVDEFPYMCKGNKSIPSILQNLWDAELKDGNVMIVLCGSAMNFIEKELLAENFDEKIRAEADRENNLRLFDLSQIVNLK